MLPANCSRKLQFLRNPSRRDTHILFDVEGSIGLAFSKLLKSKRGKRRDTAACQNRTNNVFWFDMFGCGLSVVNRNVLVVRDLQLEVDIVRGLMHGFRRI